MRAGLQNEELGGDIGMEIDGSMGEEEAASRKAGSREGWAVVIVTG